MIEDTVAQRTRRSLLRPVGYGVLVGILLVLSLNVYYVLLGTNFHTVIPGEVYRSAQLSAASLESLIRGKNIRTIVNLRGCCDPESWYLDEGRVTLRNNVSLEDLSFSAGRLPSLVTVRQLLEVIDRSEYPILFHCHKGADRTGMASVMALLLRTETPLKKARQQLGILYGHLSIGHTANIDHFFDLYEEWLNQHNLSHSPAEFRRWIEKDYCPGDCQCRLELLDQCEQPLHLHSPLPSTMRIRCHNTSIKPWRFHPSSNSGVHLVFMLSNDRGQRVAEGKAGLFHAVVAPHEFIDLKVVLPGLMKSGAYELRLDMLEEQHAYFLQTGSQPLICKVEVP